MTKCCFQGSFLKLDGFSNLSLRVSEDDASRNQRSVDCSNVCPGCVVGIWHDVKKHDCEKTLIP